MSDSLQLLQQVAAQLQQEGKTPSLALFRARLAGQIPTAQLFSAYQHWRANPSLAAGTELKPRRQSTDNEPVSEMQQAKDIATRLARIEAKLEQILVQLGQR